VRAVRKHFSYVTGAYAELTAVPVGYVRCCPEATALGYGSGQQQQL
jgi:hypothetical protein